MKAKWFEGSVADQRRFIDFLIAQDALSGENREHGPIHPDDPYAGGIENVAPASSGMVVDEELSQDVAVDDLTVLPRPVPPEDWGKRKQ